MAIVPICLRFDDSLQSNYISLPVLSRNDEEELSCPFDSVATVYAIHPDFRPIPPGAALFCAQKEPIVNIKTVYDPFDYQKGCSRFIAWIEPVPHTTPLYIYKKGNNIRMSFKDEFPKGYHYDMTLFVLTDPRDDLPTVPGFTNDKFAIVNGQPQFMFEGYQGRCLPDPNGIPLSQCIVLHTEKILSPVSNVEPSLLDHLRQVAKQKTANSNISPTLSSLIFLIFLISVLLLFFFPLSGKKKSGKK